MTCYILFYNFILKQGVIEYTADKTVMVLNCGIMGDKGETEEEKAIAQAVATEHMAKVVEKLKCLKVNKKAG
ncbi:hypothetical protein [Sporomusa acidovorans]|uniref:hypothetical protein n=1 Tax=Sporomusa acidovorans TaxID=112900 RepID=UPI00146EB1A7|nr:hypothetical protein [Sporomusa acidovorans]